MGAWNGLLDLAGPTSVLRAATLLGAEPGYQLTVASPGGRQVTSDSGIRLTPELSLAAAACPVETLLVVGGRGVGALVSDAGVL